MSRCDASDVTVTEAVIQRKIVHPAQNTAGQDCSQPRGGQMIEQADGEETSQERRWRKAARVSGTVKKRDDHVMMMVMTNERCRLARRRRTRTALLNENLPSKPRSLAKRKNKHRQNVSLNKPLRTRYQPKSFPPHEILRSSPIAQFFRSIRKALVPPYGNESQRRLTAIAHEKDEDLETTAPVQEVFHKGPMRSGAVQRQVCEGREGDKELNDSHAAFFLSPTTTMSNDDPHFPPELEREIFETAAEMRWNDVPDLRLVARRVHEWLEPFLYRNIHISEHTISTPEEFLGIAASKSPEFLARAVRRVTIQFDAIPLESELLKIYYGLRLCTGITGLAFGGNEDAFIDDMVPLLAHMHLQRLKLLCRVFAARQALRNVASQPDVR
ncbi:hypothetical protein C8F01DRAFT_1295466 [Mycena amicta]|nr:hypothetical protein C8F01DRAFT_1295466 [Mycena amicta]